MEHDLLCGAAAHGVCHLVEQLVAGHGVAVLGGHHRGVAERTATRKNRHLGHRIGVVHGGRHQRMATLVVRGVAQLVQRHALGTALRTGLHAVDGLVDGTVIDQLRAGTGAQQRGLVEHVGQIGAGEARGADGDHVQIDVRHERLALGVHLQNLLAAFEVRRLDGDLAVETSRAQQCRVEHVGTVGRGDNDQVRVVVEAVHLDQQLVQRLFALVVAAAHAGAAALAADRVDLIDEDDGRRVLLGLVEQVTHTRRAQTDEHLHEVGARHGVERHAGLACDGSRQQRLTGSRRAVQQHAARDAGAQCLVARRILEEVLDLLDFLHGGFLAGHVGELGGRGLAVEQLAAVLLGAHAEHAAGTAHTAHHEPEQAEDDQERQQRSQQVRPDAALLHGRGPALGRIGLLHGLDHLRGLRVRVVELHVLAVVLRTAGVGIGRGEIVRQLQLDLLRVVDDLRVFHAAVVQDLHAVLGVDGLRSRTDEKLEHGHGEQRHDHDPQPRRLPERSRPALGTVGTVAVPTIAVVAIEWIGEGIAAPVGTVVATAIAGRLARTRKTHA